MKALHLTGCLLLAVGVAAAAERPANIGMSSLFSSERLTLVYPADPEVDARINRLSAETRAGWLSGEFGVPTRVVSDASEDPADRLGDLLLLGWNNRWLSPPGRDALLKRSAIGWAVDDELELGPGEDFGFVARSPYDETARIYFWSRIDMEMDRYNMVPIVGNDWAVYVDYLDVRKGDWTRPISDWPPRRSKSSESERAELDPPPLLRESEHYRLHAAKGLLDAAQAGRVLEARESAYRRVSADLGAPADGFRIELFVYADEKEMQRRVGPHDQYFSIPRRRELHLTLRLARSSNAHEDVHVLAREIYGPAYLTALLEGLAVGVEGPRSKGELGLAAKLMLEQERIPPVSALLDEATLIGLARERYGFPAAGLLVQWLRQELGSDGFAAAYSLESGSITALARVMGRSAKAVEDGYRSWIERKADEAGTDAEFRSLLADAKRRRKLGDEIGHVEALIRALEIHPGDPDTLYKLGLADLRASRPVQAQERFEKLISDGPADGASRYVIFAHYQLGRIHAGAGRTADARAAYRRMLELPDRHDSHRMAREALGQLSSEAQETQTD